MPALEITKLSLSHFRSYKSFSIAPNAPLIAIYGANGAGKTNILEALTMLSPGSGLRRAKPIEMARAPEALGWKIRASISGLDGDQEIETSVEGVGSRSVLINDKKSPQLALGHVIRMVWLVPVMDRLWVEGAEGRRRFLDRLCLGHEPKHGEIAIGYERAMRERNRMLKDGITDPAWYDAIEGQMASLAAVLTQNRLATIARLQEAQAGAATEFPAASLALHAADGDEVSTQASDIKEALADNRYRDMAAGRSLTGPHRQDLYAVYAEKEMAAKLCSTGEQKALLVSLVLSSGRALAEDLGAAPVMLLDEVTAHLDRERTAALFDEIEALGAQAWMTGTGAELFADLTGRADFVHINERDGLSYQIR